MVLFFRVFFKIATKNPFAKAKGFLKLNKIKDYFSINVLDTRVSLMLNTIEHNPLGR
jgi:hypothetical protein